MNAMLISSGLPQNMWGEAISSANYLFNKVLKKKAEKTPLSYGEDNTIL